MKQLLFSLILRRIKRNRFYTMVNVIGLSIAFTASLLIYSHIVKEFKTDRFHRNGKDIYRMNLANVFTTNWVTSTCGGLGPAMQDEVPGVERYARVHRMKYRLKVSDQTDEFQPEHTILTDNQFFRMFSFPLVAGEVPEEPKEEWCVLSEEYARLCFGKENPVGKVVVVRPENGSSPAKEVPVAGIMRNIPAWSTIQADVVLNCEGRFNKQNAWMEYGTETYLQLSPQTDAEAVSASIADVYGKYKSDSGDNNRRVQGSLQPLHDIYFGSSGIESYTSGGVHQGSRLLTLILSGVAFVILILAFCNYMLIKVADLNREFPLLAVQKCYGASSRSIQWQLLTEMALQIFAALLISLVGVRILHPYFIAVLSPKQPYALQLTVAEAGLYLLYITALIGGIASVFHLYVRSKLNTANMKGLIFPKNSRTDLKEILAIVQMCILCTLIFVSAYVLKQMRYLENKDLGINTENMLWVQIPNTNPNSLKSEILQNPRITHASNSSALPEENLWQVAFAFSDSPDNPQDCNFLLGDCDFLSTFGVPLFEGENINPESHRKNAEIAGRFYKERSIAIKQGKTFSDAERFCRLEHQVLVNRKFVKVYGLKQPVGTLLAGKYGASYRIVGVTEDFHYQPLYKSVEPVIIAYDAGFYDERSFNLRYREGSRAEVLAFLKTLNEKQPRHPESLVYSEYRYSDIYDKDIAFIRLIHIFTLMALLIGSMGIFSFSIFLAENRKKEVAVRKVNGATEWDVIALINRRFAKRTLIACLTGFPVGYFFVRKWLENFAYKTSLEWWALAGVVLVCVVFVMLVVSFQTWKSATVNPVECLKKE